MSKPLEALIVDHVDLTVDAGLMAFEIVCLIDHAANEELVLVNVRALWAVIDDVLFLHLCRGNVL